MLTAQPGLYEPQFAGYYNSQPGHKASEQAFTKLREAVSASLFTAVNALRSKSSYFNTPDTDEADGGSALPSLTRGVVAGDGAATGTGSVEVAITAMTPQDLLVSAQTQADQLKHAAFYTVLANATCAPFALRFGCSVDDAIWTVSAVSRIYIYIYK